MSIGVKHQPKPDFDKIAWRLVTVQESQSERAANVSNELWDAFEAGRAWQRQ